MKLLPLTLIMAGLLTACSSSNNNDVSLAIQELDAMHYNAAVRVLRSGKTGDSSHLREIHRLKIQLTFFAEKFCNSGINIARPTASQNQDNRHHLNYVVTCSSS